MRVPRGIALDLANNKLYLTSVGGKLQRMNLDGTGYQPDLIVNLKAPHGIAVDVAAKRIYWAEQSGIRRANLDGSNIEDVVTGLMAPSAIAISVPTVVKTTPPETTAAQPNCDVNGDGTISDMDAVLVAEAFGTNKLEYDVNGDGSVDRFDLLLVFENCEEAAGAPSGIGTKFTTAQIDNIREQLEMLAATNDRSPAALRTLAYLRSLLASARPAKTQLLANYPNPFNPETWIPYELAADAHVRIVIYDTRGVVIRTLQLGHQSSGFYTTRQRAAYWDGRNALGERVASGVYFYQLQADEISQMRKMLILK